MSKTGSLEKRPDPPNLTAMMEDMKAATEDDILFHVMASFTDEDTSPSDNSLSESLLDSPSLYESTSKTSQKVNDKSFLVDATYTQVQRLLELQTSLDKSAQRLQSDYEHLQSQGENVSQSLADFREKADSVMK